MKTLLLLLVLLAPPLWGQATPSIGAPRADSDRRDVVTLREYIDIRLNALEAKVDQTTITQQLAIDKALASINERLANTNEWRAQSKDREGAFATKDQVDTRSAVVDQRLNAIDNRFSSLDGSLKILMIVFVVGQAVVGFWLTRRQQARANYPYRKPRNGDAE